MTESAPVADGQVADAAPEAQGQADTTQTPEVSVEPSSWYQSAPEEVRGYIQNKGWDDPIKAVTSYQELEKFRGASEDQLIKLPKDMSADGAMDDIYNRLGRPENADGYKVELPDGVQIDSDRMGMYAEAAHKAGISQSQFEALAKLDAEYMAGVASAENERRAEAQEAEYQQLIKDWGSNAAEREELSRRGLRALLPDGADADDTVAKIEEAIGTAATLRLFANAGDRLAREGKIHDSGDDTPFGYTRDQATADKAALMSELRADPARLQNYNKAIGPDYDKMQRIQKILAG